MTVLYRAARWLVAGRRWRRLARAAWRDGADLYAALVWLTAEPERPIWPEPGTQTPCPNPMCAGRHCKGCEEPARITATWTRYDARHDFSEVPPSLVWLAGVLSVTGRAAVVARAVNPNWKPRPHQTEAVFRAWARRKLGRELLLGSFARPAGSVLP